MLIFRHLEFKVIKYHNHNGGEKELKQIRALINKETLVYVCTQKKVSPQYLIRKGGFKEDRLNKWLNISETLLPTVKQAKTLAACLHLPFAALYMNSCDIPVHKIPVLKNMRTLWNSANNDDSELNIAVIDLLMERDFLIQANNELGILSVQFTPTIPKGNNPIHWAEEIRKQFDIDIGFQYRCPSPRQFYLYLRGQIESKGIFVHCFTDVSLETARGLAIYDNSMPIIGINDEDRPPAKSFSIIHELVHIFKRDSSLCTDMVNGKTSMQEEIFCNAVSGELLVPKKALSVILRNENYQSPYSKENIAALANKFSVSREVIIRRLLDTGRINDVEYQTYADEFQQEIEQRKEEQRLARQDGITNSGPRINVSREAIDRTSPSVCKALYQGYNDEIYSKRDIAHHLGIDQKHIDKFLVEVSRWNR